MQVWTKLTEDKLYDIADELGVAIADRGTVYNSRVPIRKVGRAYHFGLRPTQYKDSNGNHRYQRLSASAFHDYRRVHAVCWHGYRDFLLTLFQCDPTARVKTIFADYRGLEDFNDKYPETAYRNVGSQMFPRYASEVCTC